MIHIIVDYNNIICNPDAGTIHDNNSYLQAHVLFGKLKLPKDEATFIIRQQIYRIWIERFLYRLDESFYSLEFASLKGLLESKWKCVVPEELTDDNIRECGFLDFQEIPEMGENFDDFILRVSFGIVFAQQFISLEDIPALLEQSKSDSWNKSQSHIFLKAFLDRRFNLWLSRADKNLNILLNKFIKSPSGFYTELISFAALKAYKKIGIQYLPDFQVYDSMSLPLNKLKFSDKDVIDVLNYIEYELNTWDIPKDPDSINEYISKVGGNLELEYNKIDELIEKHPELLTKDVIILLKKKFRLLPSVLNNINSLEKRIPPPFPSLAAIEWSTKQMMDWAINEYFPYYQWTLLSTRKFEVLEPLSIIFSDWFFHNFENIKYNSGRMLFNFVPNNFEEFADEKQMDVVLIVDNLPWFFIDAIKNSLSDNGYYLGSTSAYLTHIPTLTEFCKKCLVSGLPTYNEVLDPSYKKILEDGGWLLFKDKLKLKYYPTIGSFYKETKLEGNTHFINYLQLDELLHKSEEALGVTHFQSASDAINTLMKNFIRHLNTVTKDKFVRLHIISDHGATFIEPSGGALLSKEFIKLKGLQEYSSRYAVLPGNPDELITPDILSNTYQVSKDVFGVPNNFLIARGFKSLIPTKGHCMSHGGLQPEEVIIPHLVFEKVKPDFVPLSLILLENKYRYANQNINIEIGNPNNEVVTEIYVSIQNSNFETERPTIDLSELLPKTKDVIKFIGWFKQTNNKFEKENLKLSVRYVIKEQQFNMELNLPIVMISMVEADDSGIFDNF